MNREFYFIQKWITTSLSTKSCSSVDLFKKGAFYKDMKIAYSIISFSERKKLWSGSSYNSKRECFSFSPFECIRVPGLIFTNSKKVPFRTISMAIFGYSPVVRKTSRVGLFDTRSSFTDRVALTCSGDYFVNSLTIFFNAHFLRLPIS